MSAALEPLLTVDEVAACLRVRPARVYEMAARRELPSVRIGRYVRFESRDIKAYIAAAYKPKDTVSP